MFREFIKQLAIQLRENNEWVKNMTLLLRQLTLEHDTTTDNIKDNLAHAIASLSL